MKPEHITIKHCLFEGQPPEGKPPIIEYGVDANGDITWLTIQGARISPWDGNAPAAEAK